MALGIMSLPCFKTRETLVYPLPAMPGTGWGSWGTSLSLKGHLQPAKSLWPRRQKMVRNKSVVSKARNSSVTSRRDPK